MKRLASPKVIRDPVHNLITLPAGEEGGLILDLIDHPDFQRLRRIRQLGLSFLTFPGTEHSRWVHSLGTYHIARRMLDALRDRYGEEKEAYGELNDMRREILAAALLHDVGHGPFSHLFEKALPRPPKRKQDDTTSHEAWSQRVIRERFGDLLETHGLDVDIVTGLIDAKDRRNLLAKDLISSQLDADRMDYLLRDSRGAGGRRRRLLVSRRLSNLDHIARLGSCEEQW